MVIRGEINLPGDKSISHRALMISALSQGKARISNISTGEDIISTYNCLKSCGLNMIYQGGDVIKNGGKLTNPNQPLDCGNSGTTARLLMGLLVGQGISATFTGDSSLSRRPMLRILKPLELMGLKTKRNNGRLPIKTDSNKLNGIKYSSNIASAQIKSSILLAGLGATGPTF